LSLHGNETPAAQISGEARKDPSSGSSAKVDKKKDHPKISVTARGSNDEKKEEYENFDIHYS